MILILGSILFGGNSCEEMTNILPDTRQDRVSGTGAGESDYMLFAQDDGSVRLSGSQAEQVKTLLDRIDPNVALAMGETRITDEQYREIKEFTDKNLAVPNDPVKTFHNIFTWIVNNISYDYADNDPYPVFIYRKGVCQGYANLLKVMCISQGIPTIIANGYISYMAHAWNYVYLNGEWKVSDPTNSDCCNNSLEPESLDIIFHENDQFVYNYEFGHLNIKQVKTSDSFLVIPFGVSGIQITSFNPVFDLPSPITEISLGRNIETLGEDYLFIGLKRYGQNIRKVMVDKENTELEEYGNIIYKKKTEIPYYIPLAVERIEMKAIEVVDKNFITNIPGLVEIVFAKGTKRINSYAVDYCAKLKKAYVPHDIEIIAEDAFTNVSEHLEIIRYEENEGGTGIPVVTID